MADLRIDLDQLEGLMHNMRIVRTDFEHAEQFSRIGRLHAAAIKKSHTLCDFSILCRQLRTNSCMHFLRLLGRCSQSGADGPDWLVSDDCIYKSTDAQRFDDAT